MKILINEKQLKNIASHLIKEQKGDDIFNKYFSYIKRDKAIKLLNLDPKSKVEGDKIINVGEGAKILFQIERVEPIKEEDYPKAELYLSLLYKYNLKYNIDSIKSLPDLYKVVKPYMVDANATLDLIFDELPEDEYSIVFQDSKWIIVIPHTERASCWLGVNTQWCTTYGKYSLNKQFVGRTDNAFKEYNAGGNLYIIINKQHEDEKYQIHIESSQFMDANDEEIDVKSFYEKNKSLSNFFKKIGDDLIQKYVDGDLELAYLPITSLGKLKRVDKNLHLTLTSITSLDNLEYVGGYLSLIDTQITSLGNLKHVGRGLYLRDTPITSLGNLEYVGRDLTLRDIQITSLGNLKRVGGYLDLRDTPITSLGNLEYVGDYLNLTNTPITSLGNLEYVGGYLDLLNTPITSLGKLKRVGGGLYLKNTQITSLGNLEEVDGGNIHIKNTPLSQKYSIEELEEMYPQFIGKFSI